MNKGDPVVWVHTPYGHYHPVEVRATYCGETNRKRHIYEVVKIEFIGPHGGKQYRMVKRSEVRSINGRK